MAVEPNPRDALSHVWLPPASARTYPIFSKWDEKSARTYHHNHRCERVLNSQNPNELERVPVDDPRLAEIDAIPCPECVSEDESGLLASVL